MFEINGHVMRIQNVRQTIYFQCEINSTRELSKQGTKVIFMGKFEEGSRWCFFFAHLTKKGDRKTYGYVTCTYIHRKHLYLHLMDAVYSKLRIRVMSIRKY